jgi:(heptosyl)LPS beta-1,4-glucosyltransferase
MTISVIIPVLNESEYLPGCLTSVAFADEVIVVDSGSSDDSVLVSKKAGAKIIHHPWEGFSQQKNAGAKEATSDWLLFVDADERVSKELRLELTSLDVMEATVCIIPRLNYILGKAMKHGGWYPDYQRRLVRRDAFLEWQSSLHEFLVADPNTEKPLNGNIIHFTHRGIDWMLKKTQHYAKYEAELYLASNHPEVKAHHFFTAPVREFLYRAIRKHGYKDGIQGWIEIFYQAFNAFLIKVYLWELQQGISMDKRYGDIRRKIDDEL